MEKDFCKYVDVFYGNGEVDHFPENGLASKWFYIKALCGNTTPHAVLPFGRISAGAYSGGYPTGYGNHYPNSCGGIKKISSEMKIKGFSHLHQSGTGAMQYYYNYAIVIPFYDELDNINKYHKIKKEYAVPGYYSAEFNDISCELTVNETTAFHRYKFKNKGGKIAIDFSNDGLLKEFGERFYGIVKDAEIEIISDDIIYFSGVLSGIRLYFCVQAYANNINTKIFNDTSEISEKILTVQNCKNSAGAVISFDENEILLKVSYSTKSVTEAQKNIIKSDLSFDKAKEYARNVWNKHLSVIEINSEDETVKEKFYSNLYHSVIKPCDMTGENILGINNVTVSDIATFWDQYKTVFPLIFTLYKDMGERLVSGIINISRTFGKIPCSIGLSDIFPTEEQGKMFGIITLCDAFHFGVNNINSEIIDECIKRELKRDDFKQFSESGIFERYTHILDTTDACLDAACITQDEDLKNKLLALAENWINAYNKKDGLMSEKSPYYEGDRYTYSFRLQKNMDDRIELAGGKEKFEGMLDDFFGFGKESLRQLTYIGADKDIENSAYHRFEGFNNECDMETPYAYIYTGNHDRLCDIVSAMINQSFTGGKGGLPGNNDSGGLSSCFIWNFLGIFPVAGQGEFLIGKPHVEEALIKLFNGNELKISVKNYSYKAQYVKKAEFNGEEISGYRIKANRLLKGGNLIFYMKEADNDN